MVNGMDPSCSTGRVPHHWAPGSTTDVVTAENKQKFDNLLEQIEEIMKKSPPFSEEDARKITKYLKELKEMQDTGGLLDPTMNKDLNFIFTFFFAAGADPSQYNFKVSPDQLGALSKAHLTINNEEKTLSEVIEIFLDPTHDPAATRALGDMLLDFSTNAYGAYMEKLGDLKEQLEMATKAINDLAELQKILNMFKTNYPQDYKFSPDSWDQIPDEIKRKLYESNTDPNLWDTTANPPKPKNIGDMLTWIKNDRGNPGWRKTYLDASEAYFRETLGYEVNIRPPDTIESVFNKLLAKRDDLQKMIDDMDALNQAAHDKDPNQPPPVDTGDGSPYATIKKVLEDINQFAPTSKFPPGTNISDGSYGVPPIDVPPPVDTNLPPGMIEQYIHDHPDLVGPPDARSKAIQELLKEKGLSGEISDIEAFEYAYKNGWTTPGFMNIPQMTKSFQEVKAIMLEKRLSEAGVNSNDITNREMSYSTPEMQAEMRAKAKQAIIDKKNAEREQQITDRTTARNSQIEAKKAEVKNALDGYIKAGQDNKNTHISDNIDAATNANQNLSSKTSDEIKVKNAALSQFYDILIQVMGTLNKIIEKPAASIAR